jgi:hypothetical protein
MNLCNPESIARSKFRLPSVDTKSGYELRSISGTRESTYGCSCRIELGRRDTKASLRELDSSEEIEDRFGLIEGCGIRDPKASLTAGVFLGVGYAVLLPVPGISGVLFSRGLLVL